MGTYLLVVLNMRSVFIVIFCTFYVVSAVDESRFAEKIPDSKVCQGLKHRHKTGHKLSPNQQHILELCDMQAGEKLDRKTVVSRCEKLVHKDYDSLGRYQKKKYEACVVFLDYERKKKLE